MKVPMLVALAFALSSSVAQGQTSAANVQSIALDVASGNQSGNSMEPRLAFETSVSIAGAKWLWIDLAGTTLGPGSHVGFLSEEDGGYQALDAQGLSDWGERTAMFNGGTVVIQLWVGAHDPASSLVLQGATAGMGPPPGTESLCGSDSRVPSTDNRVGRLWSTGGLICTAWRVTNGAILAAGALRYAGADRVQCAAFGSRRHAESFLAGRSVSRRLVAVPVPGHARVPRG